MAFSTIAPLPSAQFIFSDSNTERSSHLNPFVSLLSSPFSSPVHMQPPEIDRDKKRVKPPPLNPFVFKPWMTYPASCTHILKAHTHSVRLRSGLMVLQRSSAQTAALLCCGWKVWRFFQVCASLSCCSCIIWPRVPISVRNGRGSVRQHTHTHIHTWINCRDYKVSRISAAGETFQTGVIVAHTLSWKEKTVSTTQFKSDSSIGRMNLGERFSHYTNKIKSVTKHPGSVLGDLKNETHYLK